jgi:hypothetical protein
MGNIKLLAKRLQMVAALVRKDGRSADRVSFYAMDAKRNYVYSSLTYLVFPLFSGLKQT